MGYNTTVVVMNDGLGYIENDPDFGKKLARAISQMAVTPRGQTVDVSAGPHVNAATVIESHHADGTTVIAVGENYGRELTQYQIHTGRLVGEERDLAILKELADQLGYTLRRKPKR